MKKAKNIEDVDPAYTSLYKLGGAAAFTAAGLTLSEVIVFFLYPQPGTVSGWFMLFQRDRIIGLLDFWGLEVPMYAMFILVFLALYIVLRKADAGLMIIAIAFALLGSGIFFATNNPFSMLSLSDQYIHATTHEQKAMVLAAGQVLLTNTNQRAIGGFNMGLFLVSLAGLIVSWAMLRGKSFKRSIAYVGLLAHALSLADYLRQTLTSSPVFALLVILPNALLLVIWYVLVGQRLYQLGHLQQMALRQRPSEAFK